MKKLYTLFLCSFFLLPPFGGMEGGCQTFQWAKQSQGTCNEAGSNIVADFSGNSYTVGWYCGTADFDGSSISSAGGNDVFIAKYNTDGTLLWSVQAGGTGDDKGFGISLDSSGVYITGIFSGIASFGSTVLTSVGSTDVFVAKCSPSGQWLWAIKAGGGGADAGNSISTDNNGNSYITGYFPGTATFGSHSVSTYGVNDIFIAKCDQNGNWLFAQHAGGGNWDAGNSVTVDNLGSVLITGYFTDYYGSPSYFGTNTLYGKGSFVAKYDSSGTCLWAVKGGGNGWDIKADPAGCAYVLGIFEGTADFSGTTLTSVGADDYFFAKYSVSGALQFVQQLGGTSYFKGNGISVGQSDEVFITGTFDGGSPVQIGGITLQAAPPGYDEIFIAKFDYSGNVDWIKRSEGNYYHVSMGIGDYAGNIFGTGFFHGSATFGSTVLTTDPASSSDVFVTKINDFLHTDSIAVLSYCPGETLSVPYTLTDISFLSGNVLTAQLSNAAGSFASPVNIGSLNSSDASGTISATIPQNTAAGTAYRIRVIASSPLTIGADNGANITIKAAPLANAGTDKTICSGMSASLTASATGGTTPYTFLWSTGATSTSLSVLSEGMYYVTVTGSNGCSGKDSVMVTVYPLADAGQDTSIFSGETVQIGTATLAGNTYSWNPATGLSNASISNPIASPDTTTAYVLTVTNAGCTSTDTVVVTVISQQKISLQSSRSFALLAGGSINCLDSTLAVGNAGAIGTVSGLIATDTLFASNAQRVQEALSDALAAMQTADTMTKQSLPQNIAGQILTPGAYLISGNAELDGTLTIEGSKAGQYVFYVNGGFTVKYGSSVNLQEVKPENVLWIVGGNVLLEESTAMQGVIIASGNIETNSNNQLKLALFSINGDILIKNDQSGQFNFFVLPGGEFLTEAQGASVELTTPDVPACGTATFTIKANIGIYPLPQLKLMVELPPGINYAGNAVVDTLFVDDSQFPVFIIDDTNNLNIPFNREFTLSFDVLTGCAPLNDDTLTAIAYPVFTSSNIPYDPLRDTSSFQSITPWLSISQQGALNWPTKEVNINDSLCREIKVINSGTAPLTQGFTIVENYGTAIEIGSVSIGTIDANSSTVVFYVPADSLPEGGLPPGGVFTITECLRVVSCTQTEDSTDLGKSDFIYYWGCTPTDICQYGSVSANVVIPLSNKPIISKALTFADTSVCYGPDHLSLTRVTIANTGTGPAFDISYRLYADSANMGIAAMGFTLIGTDGNPQTITPDDSTFVVNSPAPTPLCRDSFLSYVYFENLGDIPKGESISLLFHTITCCPENGFIRTLRDSISYLIPCIDSTVSYYDPNFFGQKTSWSHTKANIPGINPTDIYDWVPEISLWDSIYPCTADSFITTPIYRGDTAWFAFIATDILFRWNYDNTQQLMVEFLDSGGLCFLDIIRWEVGNMILSPETLLVNYFDSVSCGGTVTAFFSLDTLKFLPVNVFNGSTFFIRYLAQCPAPEKTIIYMTASFIPSVECANICPIPVSEYQISTNVHCPGCDRSGILRPVFTARRTNYGLPDNNNNGVADNNTGLPDFSGTINNLVMVGDTLQCSMTGWVISEANPDASIMALGFRYGYYELTMLDNTCADAMTLIGADCKIITSGNSTYNFFIPPGMVSYYTTPEKKYVFDFSIDKLAQLGVDTSLYNKFDTGDTIVIEPLFNVTKNIGGDEIPCGLHNFTYVAFVPYPTCDYSGPCSLTYDSCSVTLNHEKDSACFPPAIAPPCDTTMKYYCEKSGGEFYLAGYQFITTQTPSTQVNNCVQEFQMSSYYIMGKSTFPTQFPFEYRRWGYTDTASIYLPPGFVYDSATITQARNGGIQQTVVIDTLPSQGDTLLEFGFSGAYTDDTSFASGDGIIYYSDDNHSFSFTVYAHPTCSTPPLFDEMPDQTVMLPASLVFEPLFDAETGADFNIDLGFQAMYVPPDLSAQGQPLEIEAISTDVCWTVLLENTSVGHASNIWLAADAGDITLSNIKIGNNVVNVLPGTDIFPVGDLDSYSKDTVKICATYQCQAADTLASLNVYFGWDCPYYPASLDSYPCPEKIDTVVLYLKYRNARLQQSVNVPGTTTVCDTLPVEILISSTDVANWQNVSVSAELPAGFTYNTADPALAYYPSNSSASMPAPPDISGNVLTWSLDSLSSFFEQSGLPGFGFLTLPPFLDSTRVKLKFNLYGSCGVSKSNTLVVRTKGINNCGDTAANKTDIKNISISNYPVAAEKTMSINVSDFASCDSVATVSALILIDTIATNSSDIFNFVFPEGGCFSYVPGSFTGISNAGQDTVPTLAGNMLSWQLDTGVLNDSISFSFEIYASSSSCGINNTFLFTANTYTGDSALCDSAANSYCPFSVLAGNAHDFSGFLSPLEVSLGSIAQNPCDTSCHATVTASVTGGKSPYSYLWSNTSTGDTVSLSNGSVSEADSLCSGGSYTVFVTDLTGCIDSADTIIPNVTAIDITITSTNLLCQDDSTGASTGSATGGTAPYSYLWSTGDTTSSVFGLPASVYFLTVTDSSGCTAIDSVVIGQPDSLVLSTFATDVLCYGDTSTGSTEVIAEGGTFPYSYSWNTGDTSASLSALSAGTYFITVTDTNGCTAADSAVISQPDTLVLASQSISNIPCFGGNEGSIEIVVTGGTAPYSFLWSNGDTTQNIYNLTAGWYFGTVTDANGCTGEHSFLIIEPTLLTIDSIVPAPALCSGGTGSATAYVSGGNSTYSYLWSNGASTSSVTGLSTGTYYLTVSDANGCTDTGNVFISNPAPLNLSAVAGNVTCNFGSFSSNNGSVNLTVSGGTAPYSYNWSNGVSMEDLSGLAAGTYSVVVVDVNGCLAQTSATVTQPDSFSFSFSATNVTCIGFNDGTAVINGTGGVLPYAYLWGTGATTQSISGLAPGQYNGLIADANGCTLNGYVSISEPDSLLLYVTATNTSCANTADGTTTATASGGTVPYSYLWSNASTSLSISGLSAGTYSVTATDANGCTASAQVTIIVINPPPHAGFEVSSSETCTGDSVMFFNFSTPTFGVSYNWNFGDGTTTSTSSVANITHSYTTGGSYTVTLTVSNACGMDSVSQTINVAYSSAAYNPECCSETPSSFNPNNYPVVDDVTIVNPQQFLGFLNSFQSNIIVTGTLFLTGSAGTTYSMNNRTIQFGLDGQLVIDRGITLVAFNSVFTGMDSCGTMWQGIEVYGKPAALQNSGQMGKIDLTGCTIRRAHIGIMAGRRNFTSQYGGGIVNVNGCTFFQNGIAILFDDYDRNNISSIKNSLFNGTVLPDPAYKANPPAGYSYLNPIVPTQFNNLLVTPSGVPKYHVYIFRTHKITIRGNNFQSAETGIEAFEGRLSVGGQNVTDKNTFTNLRFGIKSNSYSGKLFAAVFAVGNDFTNPPGSAFSTGIRVYNGGFSRIDKNLFRNDDANQNKYRNGIYMENSSSFYITDNELTKIREGAAVNNSGKLGGILTDYAPENKEIGNLFTQCLNSVRAWQNNSALQINCNTTLNTDPALYGYNFMTFDKMANQGKPSSLQIETYEQAMKRPAGNKFDKFPSLTPLRDIFHNCADISCYLPSPNWYIYYHHSTSDVCGDCVVPAPVGQVISKDNNISYVSNLNPCDICFECQNLQYLDSTKNEILALENQAYWLSATLDNGKTQQLLAAINSNMSNGNLKNLLAANSPLSDAVLFALINKANNSGMPAGIIKEILSPNMPVSGSVYNQLLLLLDKLPHGIQKEIEAMQTANASATTVSALERKIEEIYNDRQIAFTGLALRWLDEDKEDSLIYLLQQENTYETNAMLFGHYLSQGDLTVATTVLNSMIPATQAEQDYVDLQTMLLQLAMDSLTIFDVDSSQIAYIRFLAYHLPESQATTAAKAILGLLFGEDFEIVFPTEPTAKTANGNPQPGNEQFGIDQQQEPYGLIVRHYPEPSGNLVYLECFVPSEVNGAILKIYSVTGEEQTTVKLNNGKQLLEINTSGWSSGMYFYSITAGNGDLLIGKMTKVNE